MAMPTLLPQPWPSGPVVVSMPVVKPYSGWPGVTLSIWRKFSMSFSDTAASFVTLPSFRRLTLDRWISEYSSSDAWPAESTKRSRFGHSGSAGS